MRPVIRRRRSGFTLIELLIAMVLTSIVMAAVVSVMLRQQRFYRGTAALIETRSHLRQAAMILSADLRGISTHAPGPDLVQIAANDVLFRGTFGSSVVCIRDGASIIIPPLRLASGNVLTSWSMQPSAGDTVLVFDDKDTNAGGDDEWIPYEIIAVGEVPGGCPPSSGLTTTADNAVSSYQLLLSGTPPPSTLSRPVRFTRVMRYALYQAGDSEWYLGYCSPLCNDNQLEPVAGPLLSQAQNGAGVALTYHDEDGAATGVPTSVARISLDVRGKTRIPLHIEGMQKGHVADSLRVVVGIRNRQR